MSDCNSNAFSATGEDCHEQGFAALDGLCLTHFQRIILSLAITAHEAEMNWFEATCQLYNVETLLSLREGEIHLPKITSGGPETIDENISRTDITPEDIRKMSLDEINELLAKIRASRQTTSSSNSGGGRARTPRPAKADADELDDLE